LADRDITPPWNVIFTPSANILKYHLADRVTSLSAKWYFSMLVLGVKITFKGGVTSLSAKWYFSMLALGVKITFQGGVTSLSAKWKLYLYSKH
jgi:RNase H-fold protein (predicted Holliday junction resolvase)